MIRNATRAVTILFATLLVPAAILATPLSASASSSNHLCERNDPTVYCLGSANLSLYTAVTESTPGRDLTLSSLGGSNYQLEFSSDASECVASDNEATGVEIRPCGGTGTVWIRVSDPNNLYEWVNRYATQATGDTLELSGLGNGSTYETELPGTFGWYQKFDWQ